MPRIWIKRSLFGIGIFLALFGLFAYFALPGIIKSQAEKIVAGRLHRQLSIERIDISPYTLTINIHGVKLLEPDGKSIFVAFDNLKVNVELQSLFRLAPVVQEVRLEKPYVHLARIDANHYNVDDIIALIKAQPPSPSPEPARFAVYNIQVNDGNIEFDDQPVHAKHVISELTLGVPFISSLASQINVFTEPHFSATVNGAPLHLKGKATPFANNKEASLDFNLDAVDLTRYIGYLPFKPQFKLPGAKLDVHLTATFRQLKDTTPQIFLKGTTALSSVVVTELNGRPLIKLPQLLVRLDDLNVLSSMLSIASITLEQPEIEAVTGIDGKLNLAQLSPPATPGKRHQATQEKTNAPGLRLALNELVIKGAVLRFSDDHAARPIKAGVEKFDLTVNKIDLDLARRVASIESVKSSSADFLLSNGKPAEEKTPAPVQAATAEKSKADNTTGFAVSVSDIAISNWSASLEDHGQKSPAISRISAVALNAKNISTVPEKRGTVDLNMRINKSGQLAINGGLGVSPLHADLTLDSKGVDLIWLQPYFTDQVNLLLTSAALSSKGTIKLDQAANGELKGSFNGDLGVANLATIDKLSSNDFVRWKLLAFRGVNVQLQPLSVNVNQIGLDDFFARVIVDANGRINLQDIVVKQGEEQKSLTEANAPVPPAVSPAATAAAAPPAPATALPPIKIGAVVLKAGSVRFTDNFIKPNYTANLMDMQGTVSKLSSDASTNADVDLHGNVNSAPLNIVGRVNPLSGNLFLDLKADVRGMELAPFTPYSGKYVGYGIEKGKFSCELAFHLENRKLDAQNRVILDQLTFGDKIESPTATTLPVQLAVALLRDRSGVIDINLPIGGSLDDPQFSVVGIIFHVIGNLITKAVTAPFALLGSMFGGGEELSWLEFDPGQQVVNTSGEAKLNSLAKALVDRPALKLEITGRFDPVADREGLKRASIQRKVRTLKLKQTVGKGESADINAITITPEEYPVLLDKVYKDEDFPKERNLVGLQKDQPVAEMEKLIMANSKVSDDDLVALGNKRAQAVKDWLVKNGQVPAERIFVVAAKSGDSGEKTKASRADFSLR